MFQFCPISGFSFISLLRPACAEVEKFLQFVEGKRFECSSLTALSHMCLPLLLLSALSLSLFPLPLKTDEQFSHGGLTETLCAQLLLMNYRFPGSPFKESLPC